MGISPNTQEAKTSTKTAPVKGRGAAKGKAPAKGSKARPSKPKATQSGIMGAATTFIAMMTKIGTPSVTAPAALGDSIQKGLEEAGVKFVRVEKGDFVRFERNGRKGRSTGRAPQAKTVAKFAAACEAATTNKVKGGSYIVLSQQDLVNAGLAMTWLNTQHGWRDNYTCGACAIACGYPVYKANVRAGEKWVVCATEGVAIEDALKAAGKTATAKTATGKGKVAAA